MFCYCSQLSVFQVVGVAEPNNFRRNRLKEIHSIDEKRIFTSTLNVLEFSLELYIQITFNCLLVPQSVVSAKSVVQFSRKLSDVDLSCFLRYSFNCNIGSM